MPWRMRSTKLKMKARIMMMQAKMETSVEKYMKGALIF
jgi:hypothetical protein